MAISLELGFCFTVGNCCLRSFNAFDQLRYQTIFSIKTPSFNLLHYIQVSIVSLWYLIVSGYTYSLQFDTGGKFDGHAPGLQQGWLFGRKIVRYTTSH